jgi:N-acetylglucosaminyl-diphospho-decaprenol L-rhamnosyltransferase
VTNQTRTTVGIVAFRRPEPLRALLDALADTPYDVIVTNVGADPAVSAVCASRSRVQWIDIPNRGYAAAVNALAGVATGDTVVFTNDDVTFDGGAVEELARIVRSGTADVAVPRVLRPSGEEEGTVLALPTVGRLLLEWAILPDAPPADGRSHGVEKWRRPRATEAIGAATAVMVAVRTDVLRRIPLPEEYFLYWEELEWFWRLRDAGRRVVIVPSARVVHDGGRVDVRSDKSRLLARNAVRCVRRTQGRNAAVGALLVVLLWNLRLVTIDLLRLVLAPTRTRRERVRARWSGVRAALASYGELR